MLFPVAGVDINPLIPFFVGLIMAFILSPVGLSGGFLTLPFMITALGFAKPSVSPTNLAFNLIGPIGAIVSFAREGRMSWALGLCACIGTVVGALIGPIIRVQYLFQPAPYKAVVGAFMLIAAIRLFYETTSWYYRGKTELKALKEKFNARAKEIKEKQKSAIAAGLAPEATIKTIFISLSKVRFKFWGEEFEFAPPPLILISFIIGLVSSLIGVGGAFLLVPTFVSVSGLPIYAITGATLLFTYLTSVVGIFGYYFVTPIFTSELPVGPDWSLGLLLGAGGFFGGYLGAKVQKYVPEGLLKYLLGGVVGIWGMLYILNYFIELPIKI
ncbi:MAG: sulfite exporter TauE/SafE family protein [Euryarchaeota archaeon]|nr:sulfite exporter TauE/SafE family protein [Euryarchaeota archaeon]